MQRLNEPRSDGLWEQLDQYVLSGPGSVADNLKVMAREMKQMNASDSAESTNEEMEVDHEEAADTDGEPPAELALGQNAKSSL